MLQGVVHFVRFVELLEEGVDGVTDCRYGNGQRPKTATLNGKITNGNSEADNNGASDDYAKLNEVVLIPRFHKTLCFKN